MEILQVGERELTIFRTGHHLTKGKPREDETKPETIAGRAFYRLLYGTHPYALAPTPESLIIFER